MRQARGFVLAAAAFCAAPAASAQDDWWTRKTLLDARAGRSRNWRPRAST